MSDNHVKIRKAQMGLDMYLTGKKYWSYNAPVRQEDGFEIEEITVKLGYWRKHADLHGYIVREFGPKDETGTPIDDCQEISLDMGEIQQIIEALKGDEDLDTTQGFFFGESYKKADEGYAEQLKEDLEIFGKALLFLSEIGSPDKKDYYWSVAYRASW